MAQILAVVLFVLVAVGLANAVRPMKGMTRARGGLLALVAAVALLTVAGIAGRSSQAVPASDKALAASFCAVASEHRSALAKAEAAPPLQRADQVNAARAAWLRVAKAQTATWPESLTLEGKVVNIGLLGGKVDFDVVLDQCPMRLVNMPLEDDIRGTPVMEQIKPLREGDRVRVTGAVVRQDPSQPARGNNAAVRFADYGIAAWGQDPYAPYFGFRFTQVERL